MFQVVGKDGNDDPGPFNHGWKDTVNLDSGGRAEILIRFDGLRSRSVAQVVGQSLQLLGVVVAELR